MHLLESLILAKKIPEKKIFVARGVKKYWFLNFQHIGKEKKKREDFAEKSQVTLV